MLHFEIPDRIADEPAQQADCLGANSENKFQVFPLEAAEDDDLVTVMEDHCRTSW